MITPEEIYDEITAEEVADGALGEIDTTGDTAASLQTDVSNGSRVGRHRMIKWIVAYAMFTQWVRWILFQKEVEDLARNSQFGTGPWLVQKALEFQYGDDFILTPYDGYYDPITPANRIVTMAASVELGYKMILKAAKNSGTGKIKLSTDERIALQAHFNKYRLPVVVEVRSADPDRVRIIGKIICNAQLSIAGIKSNVEAAIFDYLQQLENDGIFSIEKLRNAVMEVTGVIDHVFDQIDLRVAGSNAWVNVNRIKHTYAGYVTIDQDHPLDETLEYVSSNV